MMKDYESNELGVPPPLEWRPHGKLYMSFFFCLIPTTILYFFTLGYFQTLPRGLPVELLKHGLMTAFQVMSFLLVQSIVTFFLEGDGASFKAALTSLPRDTCLVPPKTATVGRQIVDTVLLLTCILVPLDLVTYAIPGVLDFMAKTSVGEIFDGVPLGVFLTVGLAYNLITGVKEEFVFRGYLGSQLNAKGSPPSSLFVVAVFFGIAHFSPSDFVAGPVLWVFTATLVGFVFGGHVLRNKTLYPVILAHGLGNFISASSIWSYFQAGGFATGGLYPYLLSVYLPIIGAGLVVAIIFNKRVRSGFVASRELAKDLFTKTRPKDWLIIVVSIAIFYVMRLFFYI